MGIKEGLTAFGAGIRKRKEEEEKLKDNESLAAALEGFIPKESGLETILRDDTGVARNVDQISKALSTITNIGKVPTKAERSRGGGLPAATADPVSSVSSLGGADVNAERSKIQQAQPIQQGGFRPETISRKSPSGLTTETLKRVPTAAEKEAGFEEQRKKKEVEVTASDVTKLNIKRKALRQDLEAFFAVDDIIQEARGEGLGRFVSGAKIGIAGIAQDSPLGKAVGAADGMRKRLRVSLVRAAGDVGNLNIVEQKAAELLLPTQFDSKDVASLKRAFLLDLSKAVNSETESNIKKVLRSWIAEAKGLDVPGIKDIDTKDNSLTTPSGIEFTFEEVKE